MTTRSKRPRGTKAAPRRRSSGAVSIPLVVILLAIAGSAAFILLTVRSNSDDQIPMIGLGFAALGASFAALAIGSLAGMWRAASRANGRRAFWLAMVGGIAGLSAIGSFTVTLLSMLVWNS